MYLKMDLGYHIFINLLVNHVKNSFIKYRTFILIFALVRTAIKNFPSHLIQTYILMEKLLKLNYRQWYIIVSFISENITTF